LRNISLIEQLIKQCFAVGAELRSLFSIVSSWKCVELEATLCRYYVDCIRLYSPEKIPLLNAVRKQVV